MRIGTKGMLAGIGLMLASSTSVLAQELTIFWAEWDPANYLQELVNDYTAETGVTVTVQTTPWSDFQTKTFAELNAHGDAYDMVVGDSQWLGAASTGGHYVDLTDFITKNGVDKSFVPATLQYYLAVWRQVLVGAARGRCQRLGLPQGLVRGPRPRWPTSRPSTATTSPCPRTTRNSSTSPSSSPGPIENKYGVALYTQTAYDAMAMGVEQTIFTWGGDLGDYATTRSTASSTRRRTSRRSKPTASSTPSRRRTGRRPSSPRTTRPSPRVWWRWR